MTTDPIPPAATGPAEPARCCRLNQDTKDQCPVTDDLFEIQYSEHDDDSSLSCRTHLGELIDAARSAGQPWFMSVVWKHNGPDRAIILEGVLPVMAEDTARRTLVIDVMPPSGGSA